MNNTTNTNDKENDHKTVTGDLISMAQNGEFDVIIHGCNCFCTMGAGIAAQILTIYPQAYAADCTTEIGDKNKLGTFTYVEIANEQPSGDVNYFHIINMYTQFEYNAATKPCDYQAIQKGFRKLAKSLPVGVTIGYPLIGAGLAGGDWEIISEIINKELNGHNHTLVKWEQQ